MNRSELADYSVFILKEYYQNNITYFLNSFAKNCLWIGPAQGQIIRSKKALIDAFSKENNELSFEMRNLHIIPIPISSSSIDIIMTYDILTFYPNNEILTFQQRIELLWVEETEKDEKGNLLKDYAIRVCHISNEFPYDSRDTIYPNHFIELDAAKSYSSRFSQCKLHLKGLYNSYFYLESDSIIWMESKKNHTLIHTINKVYESVEKLQTIAEQYKNIFIRIHTSYAINPLHVKSIQRFYAQMSDGEKISIPEKKYTRIRDEIHHKITEKKPI